MNIIFDLDGTVIDSCAGIENSFNVAFEQVYKRSNERSIKEFIGPPIPHVLKNVCGEEDESVLADFLQIFKLHYDTDGHKLSTLYAEMENVLDRLLAEGNVLFICTNKRLLPTQKIIQLLAIDKYFNRVYCIDSEKGNIIDKKELVAFIIASQSLDTANTVLIGDTEHDAEAAFGNNVEFIFAAYGFGDVDESFKKQIIHTPSEILDIIK